MFSIRITDQQAPEKNPGGPSRPGRLWVETADGREATIMVDAVDIDAAQYVHQAVTMALEPAGSLAARLQHEAADAKSAAAAARRHAERAHHRVESLLGRRTNLFGEVMVTRVPGSDAVWLQDPDKGDRGFGFRFESMNALRQAFPQLWPVRWEDGRLIMRESPITPEPAP